MKKYFVELSFEWRMIFFLVIEEMIRSSSEVNKMVFVLLENVWVLKIRVMNEFLRIISEGYGFMWRCLYILKMMILMISDVVVMINFGVIIRVFEVIVFGKFNDFKM